MTTALITGGGGFIGLHLARRLLQDGCHVVLVDNFSRGRRDKDFIEVTRHRRVAVHNFDLRRPASCETLRHNFDYVYHLAAIVGVANVVNSPYDVLMTNASMLGNVLSLAKSQKDLRRFVFASTSEVYAGTLKCFGLQFPTPETTPITVPNLAEPRSTYMLSKIYGEAMCRHSGVPSSIIRPHNIYGPRMGMSHVIPELLKKAHDAMHSGQIEVYAVEHRRTFCYVDDAVEMIKQVAEHPDSDGLTLNVGNQEPEVEIGELATLICDVIGKELTVVPLPATPGSPVRRAPDMTAARRFTQHSSKVDLRTGIERTYAWYRKSAFLNRAAQPTC